MKLSKIESSIVHYVLLLKSFQLSHLFCCCGGKHNEVKQRLILNVLQKLQDHGYVVKQAANYYILTQDVDMRLRLLALERKSMGWGDDEQS